MFIEDQSEKVIFNIRFFKIRKDENQINVYEKSNSSLIGTLAEYKDSRTASIIMEEIISIMSLSSHNNVPFHYKFPSEESMKQVMRVEQ